MREKKAWMPALQGGATATLLILSACVVPAFEGVQIQAPPEGFFYEAYSPSPDALLPGREKTRESNWSITDLDDSFSRIDITVFSGVADLEEIEDARVAAEARVWGGGGGQVTQLQFMRIDGREAWGWEERQVQQGALSAVVTRMVLPYDTVTVALEFYSNQEAWMDPARQKEVLRSFGAGEREILWGWIVGGVTLAAFLAWYLLGRSPAPAPKAFELVTVPGEEEKKKGESTAKEKPKGPEGEIRGPPPPAKPS